MIRSKAIQGLTYSLPQYRSTYKKDPIFLSLFTRIKEKNNVVIFSPHLDDAVLSMGSFMAYLASERIGITVISIFTECSSLQTPLIKKIMMKAGHKDAKRYFQKRITEDYKALAILGNRIYISHLGYVDAAWRRKTNNSALYPDTVLGLEGFHDETILTTLIQSIESLNIDKSKTCIFAPVARGRHPDHILTRQACSAVYKHCFFYMDFPYSERYENENAFIASRPLKRFQWTGPGYKRKIIAIYEYNSQIKGVFKDKKIILPYETLYVSDK